MENSPNQQLANSIASSPGVTSTELVQRRDGTYVCPVGESAQPKTTALGATHSPFRVKG